MSSASLRMMILADIAANTLAIALLLLLMVTVAPHPGAEDAAVSAPSAPIEAQDEFRLLQRQPLMPSRMVMALYHRAHGNTDGKILVDIFSDRVAMTLPRGSPAAPRILNPADKDFTTRLDAFFAGYDRSHTVWVYVFSSRHYYRVSDSLIRNHHTWSELTIPQALRGSLDRGREDAWSPGFAGFLGRNFDLDSFRLQLTALLSHSADRNADSSGNGTGAPKAGGTPSPSAFAPDFQNAATQRRPPRRRSLAARLLGILEIIALWSTIAAAFGLIAYVERSARFRTRHPRMPR